MACAVPLRSCRWSGTKLSGREESSLADSRAERGQCASFRGPTHWTKSGSVALRRFPEGPIFGGFVARRVSVVRAAGPVVNDAGPSASSTSSAEAPSGGASEEALKDQLDALQQEASHVRARYNSARSRFLRLTEAAHQLRHRANVDIGLGNVDGTRKALTEKQKVIRAAELAKRRAQVLEELSSKLGEAISRKEIQLIQVLSISADLSTADKTVTVRAIPPKEGHLFASDAGVERRDAAAMTEGSPIRIDDIDVGSAASPNQRIYRREDDRLLRTVSEDEAQADQAEEILDDGKKVKYSGRDLDAENEEIALGREKSAEESSVSTLQSESSLLEDYEEGEEYLGGGAVDTSDDLTEVPPDNGDGQDSKAEGHSEGHLRVGGSREVSVEVSLARNEDLDGPGEEVSLANAGESRDVRFSDGRHLLFEDCFRDVDHQVAAVESNLRTFMTTAICNKDTGDGEMQLVGELVDQVQGLRARISEIVQQFRKDETKIGLIYRPNLDENK